MLLFYHYFKHLNVDEASFTLSLQLAHGNPWAELLNPNLAPINISHYNMTNSITVTSNALESGGKTICSMRNRHQLILCACVMTGDHTHIPRIKV